MKYLFSFLAIVIGMSAWGRPAQASFIVQHPSALGLTQGLVGHWTFDGKDMSGVQAYDRSGNGNRGTLTSGPKRTIGKIGQGIAFDGVNDYVLTNAFDLGAINTVTFSGWVKNNSATVTTKQGILYKSTQVFEIFVNTDSTICSWIKNNAAWHNAGCTSVYTDWDQWHLLTAVYNGADVRIFRDGVLITTLDNETGNMPSSSAALQIGFSSAGGSTY